MAIWEKSTTQIFPLIFVIYTTFDLCIVSMQNINNIGRS